MERTGEGIFISYRRDDAAGYAGRLEEALERRLGRGSVFRDVPDIPPGADFVEAIRKRLADAHTVLVLIGPRWDGGQTDGRSRIEDERDLVRLEVQVALESGVRVVPVLLPGATMPSEDALPAPLRALARRHALPVSDTHWDADVDRLVTTCALSRRRPLWPWVAGVAGAAVAAVAVYLLQPRAPPHAAERPQATVQPAPDPGDRLVGVWQAEVRYDWGDRYTERFDFKRHAGVLTGTAEFLRYPRAIEKLRFDGQHLHFETRSNESMDGVTREKTHAYAAELRGTPPDEVLAFRMQTTGGFVSHRPIEFEARRSEPAASAATAPR